MRLPSNEAGAAAGAAFRPSRRAGADVVLPEYDVVYSPYGLYETCHPIEFGFPDVFLSPEYDVENVFYIL